MIIDKQEEEGRCPDVDLRRLIRIAEDADCNLLDGGTFEL